jgi:hypothetical protein
MARAVDIVVINKDVGVDAAGGPFWEVAETLLYALRALGIDAELRRNQVSKARPTILLGALNLTAAEAAQVPEKTVIYNLEQASAQDVPMKPHYLDLLRRRPVWDYSRRNIAALAGMGVRARLVPIGYRRELARISPAVTEDIDVLFYGAMNDRRRWVLNQLAERGVECLALQNYYGRLRDEFIARARIVLNMHFYPRGVFEIVRASYSLANGKAMVAERNPDTEVEPDMQDAAVFAPYDGLAEACVELLADDDRRQAVAKRGRTRMAQRDIGRFLNAGLGDLRLG